MKKIFILSIGLILAFGTRAQTPEKFSYQAVIRGADGFLVTNAQVGVRLTIEKDGGDSVYVETHTDSTNAVGVLDLEIGGGTVQSGDFSAINWADGPYFIKRETDPAGGTNYTISGSSQLLSVPYAWHTKFAEDVNLSVSGDTVTIGDVQIVIEGVVGPPPPPPAFAPNYIHCNNDTTLVVEVTSANSKVWMDRNLGATQVATGVTDSLGSGSYWQWGRFADGHQCPSSPTTTSLATSAVPNSSDAWYGKFVIQSNNPADWLQTENVNLWQGVSGVNNPCPEGFRLPTIAEWTTEVNSWTSQDDTGAYASPLKLPRTDWRYQIDGTPWSSSFSSIHYYYWSSTVSSSAKKSEAFHWSSNTGVKYESNDRARGYSVRCIKD